MNANDRPMPRLARAEPDGPLRLAVDWAEGRRAGRSETLDLLPLVGTHKFYRPLRKSAALFATARLVRDGRAVEWGEGEVDMSALAIEQIAEETMTAAEFAGFLRRHRLTHASAAAALGYGKRQIENYLAGISPIPRVVVLACYGYEARRYVADAPNAPPSRLAAAE